MTSGSASAATAPAAAALLIEAAPVHRVFENAGKLVAPAVIPKQIADIKEAPLRDEDFDGVAGGVPGEWPADRWAA